MAEDLAVRKAAGVIMWHLERKGTIEEAVARAQEREPQLTAAEIKEAVQWAVAGRTLRDLREVAPDDAILGDLMDIAGIPGGPHGPNLRSVVK